MNISSSQERYTFCRICESLCGLVVTVEHDRITRIRPNKEHVTTHGFACFKGLNQHHLYQSPDRLKYPMRKSGNRHIPISWEQALEEIGGRLAHLKRVNGPDSIGMYVGTAAGFSVLHPVFAQGFMTGIGSKSMYASSTQDCSSKFAVARYMYGFPLVHPFPDLDRINCLFIIGANPVISKWSFLQVPDPSRQIRAIRERGGKVIVVDPRKTETAVLASEHHFIRPGTDVFFYLSFLNEVIISGKTDRERIGKYMNGSEAVFDLASRWPAEKTGKVTGISPGVLKRLVKEYLEAGGAALYSSTGVNMSGNGVLSYWIQEVINAVSGNLDRKGGTLVGKGIMDFIRFGARKKLLMRENRSRIGNLPSVNDAFPGGILADEILTPGEGQVKALLVTGGNPLITMAHSERLKKAFRELELLVCIDILPGETCREAHYILPATDPLQRPDLPFVFPLMLGLQKRKYLQATLPVISPDQEQKDEASIYAALAKASGVSLFNSTLFQWLVTIRRGIPAVKKSQAMIRVPQRALLNLLLKINRQPGFSSLLRHPHGFLSGEHSDNSFLGKRVVTTDGKVDLAPAPFMELAGKLQGTFEHLHRKTGTLKLITKRSVGTQNSWTHNHALFLEREGQTNYIYMHPEDARSRDLKEYTLAEVTSDTGRIRLPVRFLDTLMPGTVAVPHGWGHQHAAGLSLASETRGVNVNLLAADGPANLEPISGMARLSAIPVTVETAHGEYHHSWSGNGQTGIAKDHGSGSQGRKTKKDRSSGSGLHE